MSHDLPLEWYEEHDGQRLGLSSEKVAAEIERLRAALQSISDKCPATCDMTLAHEMAQVAEDALRGE